MTNDTSKYKLIRGNVKKVKKPEKAFYFEITNQEGDEFIHENQQYQNGTNVDESEADSPTA